MALTRNRTRVPLHPLHAVLLAGALPLFLGALLADLAYGSSFHVQWANFASWLVVGGMVFLGFALLWALVDLFRGVGGLVYVGLLVAAFVLGFVNALQHAKDAWAMMPMATVLSVIVLILTLVAVWIGFSAQREVRA